MGLFVDAEPSRDREARYLSGGGAGSEAIAVDGLYLRQPIRCKGILPNGMEALIDVSNLLAQGYRPFVTSDGSVLYFAQASRAVEGGLSFSF